MRSLDLIEIMADLVREGPQATPIAFEAMKDLRRQGAEPETLKDIWEMLRRDIRGKTGSEWIKLHQTMDAGLDRLAREIRMERLDRVKLRALKLARGLA